MEFDADLALDFSEPHRGIDDKSKERDETGGN